MTARTIASEYIWRTTADGRFVVRMLDTKWEVCSKNLITKKLDELAKNVFLIEAFKSRSREERCESATPEPVYRIIRTAVDENQSSLLRRFADAIDQYNCEFSDRSNEDQAMIHLLTASRYLYGLHRGEQFTKAELNSTAKLLWVQTRLRSAGKNLSDDKEIENEQALLPEVNWPRLYGKLGLKKIVKDAKRGRKRKKL